MSLEKESTSRRQMCRAADDVVGKERASFLNHFVEPLK
jgi:hypothetical protein